MRVKDVTVVAGVSEVSARAATPAPTARVLGSAAPTGPPMGAGRAAPSAMPRWHEPQSAASPEPSTACRGLAAMTAAVTVDSGGEWVGW